MNNFHTVQVRGWVIRSSTHSEEHAFDVDQFDKASDCLDELRAKYPRGEFAMMAEIEA